MKGHNRWDAILRRGVGVELKASYYRQAVKNLAAAKWDAGEGQLSLEMA